MTPERHPLDELHDLLSGRISEAERLRIEQHIAECADCRAELDRLSFTRDLVRRFADAADVPPELDSKVAAALDGEVAYPRRTRRFAIAAFAAAAALVLLFLFWPRRSDYTRAADEDYKAIASNALALEMRTADTAAVERWFDERLPFRTRVFDFAMMRYTLIGGRIDELEDRQSALFAYRGERGDLVVCQMFEGQTSELPPPAETREHDGITFRIYQREGRTAVFWQEGTVVCVLVGDGEYEDVISLAFAKAMKV